MVGILGKKIGMSQVFSQEDGQVFPVTVLQVGPCKVLDIKTQERDGYEAVQLGFDDKKVKNTSKALLGHFKKSSTEETPLMFIREFKLNCDYSLGDIVTASDFKEVAYVDITGEVKGRGFQGVVKRYNFGGGRASHGGDWLRKPGSVGMCQFPGRIFKGKKMPGRMGNNRKTIQNLQVVEVREEQNLLLVKGAVPGFNGSYVSVKVAKKK